MDVDLTTVPPPAGWEQYWPIITIGIMMVVPMTITAIKAVFDMWASVFQRNHESELEIRREKISLEADRHRDWMDNMMERSRMQDERNDRQSAQIEALIREVRERDGTIASQSAEIGQLRREIHALQTEVAQLTADVARLTGESP